MPHTITVPYLSFENEKIDSPVGLSELLESGWSTKAESNHEIVNQFTRTAYKNEDGRWVTEFKKEGQAQ